MNINCQLLLDVIYSTRRRGSIWLLGFVVMPNHLHIALALTGTTSCSEAMRDIKRGSARLINMKTGNAGPVWEEGFWDRVVRDERELLQKVNYMHANPVRAGLVKSPEDWPFSSCCPGFETDLREVMTGIR